MNRQLEGLDWSATTHSCGGNRSLGMNRQLEVLDWSATTHSCGGNRSLGMNRQLEVLDWTVMVIAHRQINNKSARPAIK
jgi:hypothetical protein